MKARAKRIRDTKGGGEGSYILFMPYIFQSLLLWLCEQFYTKKF